MKKFYNIKGNYTPITYPSANMYRVTSLDQSKSPYINESKVRHHTPLSLSAKLVHEQFLKRQQELLAERKAELDKQESRRRAEFDKTQPF